MKQQDSLSIILPVFNEYKTIESVLKEWKKTLSENKIRFTFIICEDGSTDGTKLLLKKIQKKYKLILNQKNFRRGYGGAVIDGIKTTKSTYILSIDSDGQCDPKDFMKFWRIRNTANIIIGWRKKRADAVQRKVFSFLFKTVFTLLFSAAIHDPSAPFVLYKKKIVISYIDYLKFLKEGFWWGFIGMAMKKKLTIIELPMHHRKRMNGETVVYKINKVPLIAVRNLIGLFRLKFA
jgi:dolichol-phosphate mannosyltransferase